MKAANISGRKYPDGHKSQAAHPGIIAVSSPSIKIECILTRSAKAQLPQAGREQPEAGRRSAGSSWEPAGPERSLDEHPMHRANWACDAELGI